MRTNSYKSVADERTATDGRSNEHDDAFELAAEEIAEQLNDEALMPPERQPIVNAVLGRPLETAAMPHQTIGKAIGLAVFASDALSSVAYATQEILLVLTTAGAIYFSFALPIASAIAVLLVVLTLSYRQTIFAYPNGGGAYIVARDNLGEGPAQTAGAALLTDYVLTVSVSIASGVEQIVSAFPALRLYQVEIGVGMVVVMMMVNLRGVKESGRAFAGPTYFFIAMMFLTLGVGFYRLFSGTLGQVTGVEAVSATVGPLTLFLILRAFSSGCTAVTGVEAISKPGSSCWCSRRPSSARGPGSWSS